MQENMAQKGIIKTKEWIKKHYSYYNTYCVTEGNVFVLRQAIKLSKFDDFPLYKKLKSCSIKYDIH